MNVLPPTSLDVLVSFLIIFDDAYCPKMILLSKIESEQVHIFIKIKLHNVHISQITKFCSSHLNIVQCI